MFMLCWVRLAHKSHWAGVVSMLAQWLEESESWTSFYNASCAPISSPWGRVALLGQKDGSNLLTTSSRHRHINAALESSGNVLQGDRGTNLENLS